jgi:CheY-like chemotaxis protein
MSEDQRHVLLVGGEDAGFDRMAPMLRRAEFNVHTAEPSPFLLDLVLTTPFELLIAPFPLNGMSMDDLLETVRDEGSACRDAGFLLISDPELLDDAQALVDLGVNRALGSDWAEARLWQAVGDLLQIAPRVYVRVLMHADVEVMRDKKQTLYRTVNMSSSGALLQGSDEIALGSTFEFLFRLPGGGLIEGTAEVVRHTNPLREGIEGIGSRFTGFRDDSENRLGDYLERQFTLGRRK